MRCLDYQSIIAMIRKDIVDNLVQLPAALDAGSTFVNDGASVSELSGVLDQLLRLDTTGPKKGVVILQIWLLCQFLLKLTSEEETATALKNVIDTCVDDISQFDDDYQAYKREVGCRRAVTGLQTEQGLSSFDKLLLDLTISQASRFVSKERRSSEFTNYELPPAFAALFLEARRVGAGDKFDIPGVIAQPINKSFLFHAPFSSSKWRLPYEDLHVNLFGMVDKHGLNYGLLVDTTVTQAITHLYFPSDVDLLCSTPTIKELTSSLEAASLDPISCREDDVQEIVMKLFAAACEVVKALMEPFGVACQVVDKQKYKTASSYGEHTAVPDWYLITQLDEKGRTEPKLQILATGVVKHPESGHAFGSMHLGGVLDETDKTAIQAVADRIVRMGFPRCSVDDNVVNASEFARETWVEAIAQLSTMLQDDNMKPPFPGSSFDSSGEVYLITWDGTCLIVVKIPNEDGLTSKQIEPDAVWMAMAEDQDIFTNIVFFMVNHCFRTLKHEIEACGTVIPKPAYENFYQLLDSLGSKSLVLNTPYNNGAAALQKLGKTRSNAYKWVLEPTLTKQHQRILSSGKYLTSDEFVLERCMSSEVENRFRVLLVTRNANSQRRVLKMFWSYQPNAFFTEAWAYMSLNRCFPKDCPHRRHFAHCYGFGTINWKGLEMYYLELEYISGTHARLPKGKDLQLVDAAIESIKASPVVHNDLCSGPDEYHNIIIDDKADRAVIIDFDSASLRTSLTNPDEV